MRDMMFLAVVCSLLALLLTAMASEEAWTSMRSLLTTFRW
jgi:hypothetical protein